MKIKAVICPNCKDVVYSRTSQDLRYCSCYGVCIGSNDAFFTFAYVKKFGKPKVTIIKVDVSEKELYDDWYEQKNFYGVVKYDGRI